MVGFMKSNRLSLTKLLVSLLLLSVLVIQGINIGNIKAAGTAKVKVSVSSGTVNVGDTVNVTISVSGMEGGFFTLSVGYDSSILQLTSGTTVLSGGEGSYSYTFKAINPGTAYISTSGTDFVALTGDILNVSHGSASVTVKSPQAAPTPAPTTPDNKQDNKPEDNKQPDGNTTPDETTEASNLSKDCTLKSLQISPGTLEPAFSSSITVYNTKIDGNATEIYVTASANDASASVSVSGNKNLKIGKNIVKISVISESGAVSVYTINVQVGEPVEEATVVINDKTYTFETDATLLDIPENFKETTVKYDKYTIPAYKYSSIVIVSLVDEYGDHTWFTIDEATGECKKYIEYSPFFNRYYIFSSLPEGVEVPAGFTPKNFTLLGKTINGYSNGTSDIYLVYAVNIGGAEGFFLYDKAEGSFVRYKTIDPVASESDAVQTESNALASATDVVKDDSGVSFATFIIVTAILSALLLVAIIIIIVILSKNKANNSIVKTKNRDEVISKEDKTVVDEIITDEPVNEATDESVENIAEDITVSEAIDEDSHVETKSDNEDDIFVENEVSENVVSDTEDASNQKNLTREQLNILKEMQNMKKAANNGEIAEEER